MTDARIQPKMMLMRCETFAPERITPATGDEIERSGGAVGVGHIISPDGEPTLVISIHTPDGTTLMARMDVDQMERFMQLGFGSINALARFVPGQPAELPN